MLTRAWMGRVSPEWTIRVGGRATRSRRALDPAWAEADDRDARRACAWRDGATRSTSSSSATAARCISCAIATSATTRTRPISRRTRSSARSRACKGFKGEVESRRPGSIGSPSTSASIGWRSRRRAASRSNRPSDIDLRAERPDAALLRDERAAEVRAAIRQLPPKQRATLILRVYHELPHEEIAGILGSSVGAAKANLFHALANLKKLLR